MFQAYAVAVKLSLINNVSSSLGAIALGFASINRHQATAQAGLTAYEAGLSRIKKLSLISELTTGIGAAGLFATDKMVDQAKEYGHQLALMNRLGMSHVDVMNSINAAWATTRSVQTTSASENLAAIRELRSAFGDGHFGEALAVLPTVQKVKALLTSLTGREQEHVGFDMVKAIELRSKTMTTSGVMQNAERMSQVMTAMGGTLNVSDFHQALKYGKQATMQWSDDFVYSYLPTLMQEVKTGSGGASSAGTMLAAAWQAIVGGKLKKSAIPEWVSSGLVSAQDIVRNSTGSFQIRAGGVHGVDLFQSNPYEWAQKFLKPAVEQLMSTRHISMDSALGSMFGDRNASFVMGTFLKKATQFERDKDLINKADSYKAYNKLLATDPELAELALHKQWQNLLSILGYQIMPTLVRWTLKFVDVFSGMASWFREHSTMAKLFVAGFAGLSALLFVGGPILLGLGALAALGVSMTTGAIALGVAGFIAALAPIIAFVGFASGGTKTGDFIGRVVAGAAAAFGSKEAQDAILANEGYGPASVRARHAQPINITVQSLIDGKQVSESVGTYFEKSQRRANRNGPSLADPDSVLYPSRTSYAP